MVASERRYTVSNKDRHPTAPSRRRTFENVNDPTIYKAFVRAIFVEVEPGFLLIVREVKVLFGKFLLNCLLVD